jgi:hypothetical protein
LNLVPLLPARCVAEVVCSAVAEDEFTHLFPGYLDRFATLCCVDRVQSRAMADAFYRLLQELHLFFSGVLEKAKEVSVLL